MKNALTFDLEDWYYPEFVKNHVRHVYPQIHQSTVKILELLDKYNVKATFFVLGEVSEKNPKLIKMIYDKGHEIASHGLSHIPLWELDYAKFDRELKTFKRIIKGILGNSVKIDGFRAPSFSLDNTTKYALKCLTTNGFIYDSSIFPVQTPLYGINYVPPHSIYKLNEDNLCLEDEKSKIEEFPLTIFRIWRIGIPVCGGFYFRAIPYFLLKTFLRKINQKRTFVIYIHPWETFSQTPKLRSIGFRNYIITYYGIGKALSKLEKLLRDFEFDTMNNVIKRENSNFNPVRRYFETCADRFDGFYHEKQRSKFQQFVHKTLRLSGLRNRFEAVVRILGNVKGKTILDIGCGSGIYSIYFAKKGAKVTGLDFSSNMIALAIGNSKNERCSPKFEKVDFLDYENKSKFDYLLFIGFFDYVKRDDVLKFLSKAEQIANKKIVATFPKKYAFQAGIRYIWLRRQKCPVYFYTKKQIKKIAEKLGLSTTFHDCGPIWTVDFAKALQTVN